MPRMEGTTEEAGTDDCAEDCANSGADFCAPARGVAGCATEISCLDSGLKNEGGSLKNKCENVA